MQFLPNIALILNLAIIALNAILTKHCINFEFIIALNAILTKHCINFELIIALNAILTKHCINFEPIIALNAILTKPGIDVGLFFEPSSDGLDVLLPPLRVFPQLFLRLLLQFGAQSTDVLGRLHFLFVRHPKTNARQEQIRFRSFLTIILLVQMHKK